MDANTVHAIACMLLSPPAYDPIFYGLLNKLLALCKHSKLCPKQAASKGCDGTALAAGSLYVQSHWLLHMAQLMSTGILAAFTTGSSGRLFQQAFLAAQALIHSYSLFTRGLQAHGSTWGPYKSFRIHLAGRLLQPRALGILLFPSRCYQRGYHR